jgi:hypothetical protein
LFVKYDWDEMRNSYTVLVAKREGKTLLTRPRHSWEDNNQIAYKETECEGVDWDQLAQDRDQWWALVNTVINPGFHRLRRISFFFQLSEYQLLRINHTACN